MGPRRISDIHVALLAILYCLVGVACVSHAHPSPGVARANLLLCTATYADDRAALNCRPTSESEWAHDRSGRELYGSGGQPPVFNPNWAVATWCWDEQNASGCASDTLNDGYVCTCGASGHGPLATIGELIVHRWGNTPPLLKQATVVSVLSSAPSNDSDNMRIAMAGASFGSLTFLGTLTGAQSVGSGTLSGVVAKDPNASQLLQSSLTPSSGSVAIGQKICNTTRNPQSCAWVNSGAGGSVWNVSQPIVHVGFSSLEDNGWTSGDSYTLYAPVQIRLTSATVNDCGNSFLFFKDIGLQSGVTSTIGNGVYFWGSQLLGNVSAMPNAFAVASIVNSDLGPSAQFIGQNPFAPTYQFFAGQARSQLIYGTFYFKSDFILAGGGMFQYGGLNNNVWISSNPNTQWHVNGATQFTGYVAGTGIVNVIRNGSGAAGVLGQGSVQYTGTAAATFLLHHTTGPTDDTLQVNYVAFADAMDRTVDPAVFHAHRPLTAALLDTAVSGSGFRDIAYSADGASAYELVTAQ